MPTCKKCGSMQNVPLYGGECDACLAGTNYKRDHLDYANAKKQAAEDAARKEALEKMPGFSFTDKVNVHSSPHVPPGQAYVFSGDLLGGGDDHIIAGSDFLGKLVGSTLSPEELQAGMGILGKIDQTSAQKIIERTAVERTRQIEGIREKIKMLLRPVVDDDMGDQELEGLANALMAAMSVLGGGDVMSIYGVSG